MPWVEPITVYDARRRKPQDTIAVVPQEHMVYFAHVGHSPLVKVGRTKDIAHRASGHQSQTGQVCRYAAQLLVASNDEAKALERHVLVLARERFDAIKREWLVMSEAELAGLVRDVLDGSPVEIVALRGAPGVPEREYSVVRQALDPVDRVFAGRRRF